MNSNIVLTGLMGAGKSTVGKLLAELLEDYYFVDIDDEIVRREGISISDIFSTKSEEYFRSVETGIIKEFAHQKNYIISIGGGAFEFEENRTVL